MKKKKLHITRTTIQQLSSSQTAKAHGGMTNITYHCYTNACPTFTASCKHSVCDSCYNTDCCLLLPGD